MKSIEISVKTTSQSQFVNITAQIQKAISQWQVDNGCLLLFVPHTTAAVTINEGADPDVLHDLALGLDALSPQRKEYRHLEGNSPAHLKSSLIGCDQMVWIKNGKLDLGTWQSIYFCEFDGPRNRQLKINLLS